MRFIHLRLGVPTLGTSGGSTVLCCAVFLSGLLNIAHGGNPIYMGVLIVNGAAEANLDPFFVCKISVSIILTS